MCHDDLWAYLGNNRRDRLYGKSLVKDLMLNDYCPELGRIMEALAEEGFAERISQAARQPGLVRRTCSLFPWRRQGKSSPERGPSGRIS
ncbi:MAG: hypothetical protein SPL25_01920 [Succinivibrionaceae bacterium]|nr:hypothetical protein [Succinivibrionaceae bacterium]